MTNTENDKKEKPHVNVGTIGHIDHTQSKIRVTSTPMRVFGAAAMLGALTSIPHVPHPLESEEQIREDVYGKDEPMTSQEYMDYLKRSGQWTKHDVERLEKANAKRARKAEKRRIEQEKRDAKTRK